MGKEMGKEGGALISDESNSVNCCQLALLQRRLHLHGSAKNKPPLLSFHFLSFSLISRCHIFPPSLIVSASLWAFRMSKHSQYSHLVPLSSSSPGPVLFNFSFNPHVAICTIWWRHVKNGVVRILRSPSFPLFLHFPPQSRVSILKGELWRKQLMLQAP